MSILPDELWRRILEMGVSTSSLNCKDFCCIAISCRRLNRLSSEDAFWSPLLSCDFPINHTHVANTNSSSKNLYKTRFERDRDRKLLAHRRNILRLESQLTEHSRKFQEIQNQRLEETQKFKAALAEISNLVKVREASVALNVWQPVVVRGRQQQLVEQCSVPIEARVNALEMELKLCKQQISGLDKALRHEKRRIDAAKEQLASIKYHPLQDYKLTRSKIDESGSKRKKLKK